MKAAYALIVLPMGSGQVFAAAKPAGTVQAFAQVAADVRAQMLPSGKHSALSPSDKTSVRNDLVKIQDLLERSGPVAKPNRANFLRVYKLQEHLNGVLTGDLAHRQICKVPQITGGRLTSCVTCETYAQRDKPDFRTDVVFGDGQTTLFVKSPPYPSPAGP